MAIASGSLEDYYGDYTLSIGQLMDAFPNSGLSYDQLQRARLKWRKDHKLPAGKGLTRPADSPARAVQEALTGETVEPQTIILKFDDDQFERFISEFSSISVSLQMLCTILNKK